jgi:CCR4-NOT transcription complex subunit 4
MGFSFSTKDLSEEQIKLLAILPPPWDPQGGVKRRMMKEREAEELARKQEEVQAALQDVAKPESTEQGEAERASGSLQLGGEPEERPDRTFAHQTAIQPPGFSHGPQFPLDTDLASLNIRGGSPAAQHQNQLLRQFQVAGASQHQIGAHGRQPSRFSFNETGGIKAGTGLQQPKNLGAFSGTQPGAPFYSGVQGPPPGLKTTGTPPVNGSGMFGQGHGFTASYAATRDADRAGWDGRTQLRGAQDAGKREYMLPFSHNSSAASTPAPGMGGAAGFPYGGPQEGQQKQKKKSKKHRHATNSSSGGDNAVGDPSILQARPYQNGVPGLNGGQSLYGAGGPGGLGAYSAYGRNW